MSAPQPTLRYLDAAAVRAALPSPLELVALAEVALRSLLAGAEVPPKAALGRGPVFAHAMPARLEASEVPGGAGGDLLGMKWIAGASGNRAAGLPAMASLIALNDPGSGMPLAVLDGDVITAVRTAALSGVAVRLLGPRADRGDAATAVLIGAGRQARAHAEVLAALLPGIALAIHDRHPERAIALADGAAALPGVGEARPVRDPTAALARADIVVTATTLGPARAVLGPREVSAGALVLPVDYGAYVHAELVSAAATFAVDDRATFEEHRRSGRLAGWPAPTTILGDLLLEGGRSGSGTGEPARAPGLAVALHQGPGIADVIVADAVLRTAGRLDLGVVLPR